MISVLLIVLLKKTFSVISLENADNTEQTIMFFDYEKQDKRKALNIAMDTIRDRYGKGVVKPCVILDEDKIPKTNHDDVKLTLGGFSSIIIGTRLYVTEQLSSASQIQN